MYSTSETSKIHDAALKLWGEKKQMEMCIEECSELIKALCKYFRNPTPETRIDVIDELADVEIMLGQMGSIFDNTSINLRIEEKRKRLWERISQELQKND